MYSNGKILSRRMVLIPALESENLRAKRKPFRS